MEPGKVSSVLFGGFPVWLTIVNYQGQGWYCTYPEGGSEQCQLDSRLLQFSLSAWYSLGRDPGTISAVNV